jgi:peroxiredoxin
MALTYSSPETPVTATDFSLKGTDGKTYSLDSFKTAKALVIVFTCNHCPYAKASEDRLIEIQNEYVIRGVQLVLINPNDAQSYPDDSFENMITRAREKHFPFPYLWDQTQTIAKAYGAVCTPDVYLYDSSRKLAYHGRIDDNWQEPAKVTRRDLRSALDATLATKPLDFSPVPSMGCSIKWKS